MSEQPAPAATYRLQLNRSFRLSEATGLLDYFAALGITDIYASPILTSRKGSQHGYDVTDPAQIDPDVGSPQEFSQFQEELVRRGMRLILDIVPNHMAASSENRWWMDVLENGAESRFAPNFDIDWHPHSRNLDGKVLLPVLGRPIGEVLDQRELRLVFQNGRFFVRYFDSTFPLAPSTYHRLLNHRVDELRNSLSEDSAAFQEYSGIVAALSLSESTRTASETEAERRVRLDATRERLQELVSGNAEIAKFIDKNISTFNGAANDPASLCALEHLLGEQKYRLAYWMDPNEAINYRRFFAISDLVGVRVEDSAVFEVTHDEIFRLSTGPAIRGFRVDHIDGLRDPLTYLKRLEEKQLSLSSEPGSSYILVEKILSERESLPADWPVRGTTGYDYLNQANGPFVFPPGAVRLRNVYFEFVGRETNYADVVYEEKKLVMNSLLRVEMRSLGRQLFELAADDRYARDLLRQELMDVLMEVTACIPVYRTYIRNLDVPPSAKLVIERAIAQARLRRPRLSAECFAFLHDVLTLANPAHILSDQRETRLGFVMRWQQFTGPIVAKGVEDTALYVYYPLASLNEVGGNPEPSEAPTREEFFEFIGARQREWPDTLNATSTHDTKRSEDVRARLNVLSEIPEEWAVRLTEWTGENQALKAKLNERMVPDANEEYLIYQSLLGLWPAERSDLPDVGKRLEEYVIKAIREAMVHTQWTEPNIAHEAAIRKFVEGMLEQRNDRFLCSFSRFQQQIAYAGMLNGLGQTLLKIACPGVPDFYQGSELWQYRLVDPDNRQTIDFELRRRNLERVTERTREDPAGIAGWLLAHWPNGWIKLYVTWMALGCRRRQSRLFRDGEFLPIEVTGDQSLHLLSFLRRHGHDEALVIIPRWTLQIPPASDESAYAKFWEGTTLRLPPSSPSLWRNLFTTETVRVDGERSGTLPVGGLLKNFPLALLTSSDVS
jgi:(1->4)-alpha-D-glucan 1-alpha-D-glucosylmutase